MIYGPILKAADDGLDNIVAPWFFHSGLDPVVIELPDNGTDTHTLCPEALDQLERGEFFGIFDYLSLEIAEAKWWPRAHLSVTLTGF